MSKIFELLDSVKKNNFIVKSIRSKPEKQGGSEKGNEQRQTTTIKVSKKMAMSVKTEERERIFRR